jgi:hypothetical protein
MAAWAIGASQCSSLPSYSDSGYIMVCDKHGLDYPLVLGRVVLKDARHDKACVCCGSEYVRDLTTPVRTHQQIEARRCPVHLPELEEAVSARVDDLVDPEPIGKVWHLDYAGD